MTGERILLSREPRRWSTRAPKAREVVCTTGARTLRLISLRTSLRPWPQPWTKAVSCSASMNTGASVWIRRWRFLTRWCTTAGPSNWKISHPYCRLLPEMRRCYSGCSGARGLCSRGQKPIDDQRASNGEGNLLPEILFKSLGQSPARKWRCSMRKHPKVTNIVVVAALGLLSMGFATSRARAQEPGALNVARVSFVQGSVQLLAGQGADFQQAVMNMPVVDGSRLQTGGDGQAEVEFGDGSVARLTPNSALQFDHLAQDQVQLQQLSGLSYYEFNVGDGHPPFSVQFNNLYAQPLANSILRVGLDAGWEVAVISGSVNVQGDGFPNVTVAENQSIRSGAENSGAPYTVAQGINGDSWDNWNQDRDQAIAQEASQQTPVRDDSANPQNENWNDLDASGNWYPVEGAGNVWVPAGVGPGWDPYGAGYWAYYPTFGYTWVSSYPWGWLPYHCGNWAYYGFGWGWAPGGCGRVWSPVIVVRNYPAGWVMPVRPVFRGGAYPLPPQRLVAVDLGPVATGPWG